MQIPQIEPFQFIRSTAFSERVQLANKINEIIDGINQIGDIPELQEDIETLKGQVESINSTIKTVQDDVSGNTTQIQTLTEQLTTLSGTVHTAVQNIAALQTLTGTHSTQIQALLDAINALTPRVTALESRATTIESDIQNIDSEISGLQAEVIDNVSMMSDAHGTVQVTIAHEDGSTDTSAPIDLGLVRQGGITLQTGATDRSFNLTIKLTDGTSWQTNDFIIPPGGGTEVVVTNIQIADGTSEGTMKVRIGLSDATFLDSNDWPYVTPTELNAVATRVTALEGTTAQHTTQIGDLTSRVQELEDNPFSLPIATATLLGGIKVGANLKVTEDGTLSADPVPDVSDLAIASSLVVTRNASSMNVAISDKGGTQHTEALPVATAALPGLMAAADKSKLDAVPTPSTIATDTDVQDVKTDLQDQITAISPTVSVNDEVTPPTITVSVNGKSSTANLPAGETWEELNLSSLPTDFSDTDRVEITLKNIRSVSVFEDWNQPPSLLSSPTFNNDSLYRVEIKPLSTASNVLSTLAGIDLDPVNGPIVLIAVNPLDTYYWNDANYPNNAFFLIQIQAFTGAGLASKTIRVSRNNITNYVTRMRRIKNFFA